MQEDGPLGATGGVEDPAAFFAHVFGGDRFFDYVSHSSIQLPITY